MFSSRRGAACDEELYCVRVPYRLQNFRRAFEAIFASSLQSPRFGALKHRLGIWALGFIGLEFDKFEDLTWGLGLGWIGLRLMFGRLGFEPFLGLGFVV